MAILIVGLPFTGTYIQFSDSPEIIEAENIITVSSFNMQNAYASYTHDKQKNQNPEKLYSSFLDTFQHTDILCVQEAKKRGRELIEDALEFKYKHFIANKGAAIFSKHPIIQKGELDFGTKTNSCLWADIQLPTETIRVYSVHLQSNRISVDAEKVVEKGTINNSATWKGIRGIFYNYKQYVKRRTEQVKLIIDHKKKSPNPSIICGDFNDPPQSYVYRFMVQNMKDSFVEKGSGFGTTYAGVIPALRIDYILTDRSFEIKDHTIIKEKYSDHFPIVSVLSLP